MEFPKELIEETINYGSCFYALEKKAFTVTELLEYLVKAEFSDKTLVAYKAACEISDCTKHYLRLSEKSVHFVSIRQEYFYIYCRYGDPKIPVFLEDPDIILQLFVIEEIFKRQRDSEFNLKCDLICPRLNILNKQTIRDNINLIVSAKSDLLFGHGGLPKETIYKLKVFNERANETISNLDISLKFILERITMLSVNAPHYFEITKEYYSKILNTALSSGLLLHLSHGEFADLNRKVPFFKYDVEKLSEICYRIALQSNVVKAYLLGFPLHEYNYTNQVLDDALLKLNELGEDAYLASIADYNKSLFMTLPESIPSLRYKLGNEINLYNEDPFTYSPVDIIKDYSTNHVYIFTREEFSGLLERCENPYTREPFSQQLICLLRQRSDLAKHLGLPRSDTLRNLYEKLKNGEKLKTEDEEDSQESSREGSSREGSSREGSQERIYESDMGLSFIDPSHSTTLQFLLTNFLSPRTM
jgi:hypothetical protein